MIDRRAAITAAVLITVTILVSGSAGFYMYMTRPELISPRSIVLGHLLGPGIGIAMWLLTRRGMRNFPDPQNLETPLKKHYGLMLVFACAFVALQQAYFAVRDLGIVAPSSSTARLFI